MLKYLATYGEELYYCNNLETILYDQKQNLVNLVDNGNTEQLLFDVQTSTQSNYWQVSYNVGNCWGYISDTVVLEFMQKDVGRPISKTIALLKNSPLPYKAKAEID